MPTVAEINASMAAALPKIKESFTNAMTHSYGPMSDSASVMLAAIGSGADISLPSGRVVTREEVAVCLAYGITPDQILETLRHME